MYIEANWKIEITPEMCDSNVICCGNAATGKSRIVIQSYLKSAISCGYPVFLYSEDSSKFAQRKQIELAHANGYEVITFESKNTKHLLAVLTPEKLSEYRNKKVLLFVTPGRIASLSQETQQIIATAETILFDRLFLAWGREDDSCIPARIIIDGVNNPQILLTHFPNKEARTKACLAMQPWILNTSNSLMVDTADYMDQILQMIAFLSPFQYYLCTGARLRPDCHIAFIHMLLSGWGIDTEEGILENLMEIGWTPRYPYYIQQN